MSIRVKPRNLRRTGAAVAMAAVLACGAGPGVAAPTPSSHMSGLPATVGLGLHGLGSTDIAQLIAALNWLNKAFPGGQLALMPSNGMLSVGVLLASMANWFQGGQGGVQPDDPFTPAEIFAKLTDGGLGLYGTGGRPRGNWLGSGKGPPPWAALFGGLQPFGGVNPPSGGPATFGALGGTDPGGPTIASKGGPIPGTFGTSRASQPSVVPLPATLPLLLAGLGGLAIFGRRKRRRA